MSWVTPEQFAAQVVLNVCELSNYTSPDDQPDLLQCTARELESCVMRAFEHFDAIKKRPSNWFNGGYLGNGHCSFMQAMNGAHYFCCLPHAHDGPHRTDSTSIKNPESP